MSDKSVPKEGTKKDASKDASKDVATKKVSTPSDNLTEIKGEIIKISHEKRHRFSGKQVRFVTVKSSNGEKVTFKVTSKQIDEYGLSELLQTGEFVEVELAIIRKGDSYIDGDGKEHHHKGDGYKFVNLYRLSSMEKDDMKIKNRISHLSREEDEQRARNIALMLQGSY